MFGGNKANKQFKSGRKRDCGLGRTTESAIYFMTIEMQKQSKVVIGQCLGYSAIAANASVRNGNMPNVLWHDPLGIFLQLPVRLYFICIRYRQREGKGG